LTPSARVASAIELHEAIDRDRRRPADAVANEFFRTRRFIGSTDRREVSTLVWDMLRCARRLDWWLERVEAPPHSGARLRVAAHMLLTGTRLEFVRPLYSGGRFAAGSLDPDEARALEAIDGHTLDHPHMPDPVRLEIPDWILPHLQARFGAALEPELVALNEPAPLDLRVNILRGTREDAIFALAREDIEVTPTPLSPWGLRTPGRRMVTTGNAFKSGLVEIQDEGSQLIALAVGAAPEMRVCDLCAGAGGKTLAIAMTMNNRGHLVACDVSATRLDAAVKRLRRAGVHNAERHLLVAGDKWAKRRAGAFDRVLVDAPCTGTGTWRRNPDARRTLTERDLDELVVRQAAILDTAARLVKPGGRLVYATCSVLTEENEQQIEAFRTRHPAFTLVAPAELGLPGVNATLSLTPRLHNTDGFFAAILERAEP
jgi:16S rRNA (cytosine967-C5)-methyltransferase